MFPRYTMSAEGALEAVEYLRGLHSEIQPMLERLGVKLLLKIQRAALENLVKHKSHLLRVELARFVSAQPINIEKDGLSWGLPVGATVEGKGGQNKPMTAIGRIHEVGGVIRPTGNNKMLRIPLPPALTGDGTDKYAGWDFHARQPWGGGSKITRWFILNRPGRNPLIVMATGRSKKVTVITPMYTLVYQATIKPKWWFSSAVEKVAPEIEPGAEVELRAFIKGKGQV